MKEIVKINGGCAVLTDEVKEDLLVCEKVLDTFKKRQEEIKSAIKADMERKNVIKIESPELTISYIGETDRETFDKKKFRMEHPEMYDEYASFAPTKAYIKVKVKSED